MNVKLCCMKIKNLIAGSYFGRNTFTRMKIKNPVNQLITRFSVELEGNEPIVFYYTSFYINLLYINISHIFA